MPQTVYTLGYQGLKPEQLLYAVEKYNAVVVDVRYRANSRQPEWRKEGLKRLLRDDYLHLDGFGNVNYKGDGPIVLDRPEAALMELRPVLEERPVILLCACWSFALCHRTKVAEYIREKLGNEFVHLRSSDLHVPPPPPDQIPLF